LYAILNQDNAKDSTHHPKETTPLSKWRPNHNDNYSMRDFSAKIDFSIITKQL